MFKEFKLLSGIFLILICIVFLTLGVSIIWGVITNEVAKDITLKIIYTLAAILTTSVIVLLITKVFGKNSKLQ